MAHEISLWFKMTETMVLGERISVNWWNWNWIGITLSAASAFTWFTYSALENTTGLLKLHVRSLLDPLPDGNSTSSPFQAFHFSTSCFILSASNRFTLAWSNFPFTSSNRLTIGKLFYLSIIKSICKYSAYIYIYIKGLANFGLQVNIYLFDPCKELKL